MKNFSTTRAGVSIAAALLLSVAVTGCSRPDPASESAAPAPPSAATPSAPAAEGTAPAAATQAIVSDAGPGAPAAPSAATAAGSGSAAERLSRVRATQQRQLRLTGPANGNPRQQLRLRDVPTGAQSPASGAPRTLRPTPAPMPTRAAPTPVEPPASNP